MVTLDFNNVDLQTFIKFISELTGKNFVIDEKVQGKVTVISPTKISVDDAYDVFLTVLDLKGFAAITEGKVIKIVPSREAKQSGSSVVTEEKPRLPEENFITRVIHLKYVSASDLTKLLSPLLTKDGNMIPYSTTNLLILSDGSSNIEKLLELIQELDVEPPKGKGGINVYYLQNAAAEDMAKVLANLVSRVPQAPQAPGGVPQTAVARFEGGVSITADKATNSLIIMAAPEDYERIKTIIEMLDVKRKQVYVEAAILEMSVEKSRELGVEFRTTTPFEPGQTVIGGGTSFPAGSGINQFAANPLGVTGLAVGYVRGTVSFGGTTFLNVGALLRALQQDTDVNVLSTPNILTMDNQEAKITVGENRPFPSAITLAQTNVASQRSIERKDVGIILRITPHTTESDMVRLDLFQEISRVSRETEDGPITDKRSAETSVMVRDRESVVIGGLITDDVTTNEHKVPFLGDIPLLGYLFKYQKTTKVKRNLMLFLTPYIIRDADMLTSLSKTNMDRSDKFRRHFHFEEKRDYLLNPPPPVEEPVLK